MSQKRTLLEVDPTIVERNIRITDPGDDDLRHLFPVNEIPSKLVKPSPGFCIKTRSETNDKIFINICQTDAIPAPEDLSEAQLVEVLQSETPSEFRVPMSIGEARPEIDKSGNAATSYDVAINSDFFKKIGTNKLFKQFLLTIIFEALQDKYRIVINTDDFVILKNRKAMGNLQLHRIQQREVKKKSRKLIEEIDGPTKPLITEISKANDGDVTKEPPYRILRMITEDNRQYFVGDFYVPDITSIKDVTLDVGEDRLILESLKRGYLVDIFLPQLVEQENVTAKLNAKMGILTITMPIVRFSK